jgi:hypothetical protein
MLGLPLEKFNVSYQNQESLRRSVQGGWGGGGSGQALYAEAFALDAQDSLHKVSMYTYVHTLYISLFPFDNTHVHEFVFNTQVFDWSRYSIVSKLPPIPF